MPVDYDMEVATTTTGRLMNPAHYTAADFPSEYDNSADAFAESASYDEAPYGHYRTDHLPTKSQPFRDGAASGTRISDSMISIDMDDDPSSSLALTEDIHNNNNNNSNMIDSYEEPIKAAGPSRRASVAPIPQEQLEAHQQQQQLQQQERELFESGVVSLKGGGGTAGGAGARLRRVSLLDPARFPMSEPASSSKAQLFATAAEEVFPDPSQNNNDNNNNNDADIDNDDEFTDNSGHTYDYTDPTRRNSHFYVPDDDVGPDEQIDYDQVLAQPFTAPPDELCSYALGTSPPQHQHHEKTYRAEETAPAYQETDENGWDVGLRRNEHKEEFQDVAGLDYGDQRMEMDDDEGMDPMENQ
ncbi:hypothetical protein DFJ77DRAFT_454637 [Powellomyces hirtus]|nr:hypothetical protein DFJ77DRAFT_454637 [Powellomyces hirtus]